MGIVTSVFDGEFKTARRGRAPSEATVALLAAIRTSATTGTVLEITGVAPADQKGTQQTLRKLAQDNGYSLSIGYAPNGNFIIRAKVKEKVETPTEATVEPAVEPAVVGEPAFVEPTTKPVKPRPPRKVAAKAVSSSAKK